MQRHEIYSQGSILEFADDGDADRYYLPLRATAHAMREGTTVLIPETDLTRAYATQLNSVLKDLEMRTPDTIFVPDTNYFLDLSIKAHIHTLSSRLDRALPYSVHPYANTEYLREWVNQLNCNGFDLSIPMPSRVYFDDLSHPQHRGGWGIWVDKPDRESFASRYDLPYPKSYLGTGLDQIIEARDRAGGRDGVTYAKLVFSAGGFGVQRIESEDALIRFYERVKESGALNLFGHEQPFEIQAEIPNIVGFGSMQFARGRLVTPGGVALQQVDGNRWIGNDFNTSLTSTLSNEALELAERFTGGYLKETVTAATGGLDLAIVRDNGHLGIVLVEPNLARTVGADPAISLARTFGVSDKPFTIRKTNEPQCDLTSLWKSLKDGELAYNPNSKTGVFPLLWMPETDGFFFAVGNDERELQIQIDSMNRLIDIEGCVK